MFCHLTSYLTSIRYFCTLVCMMKVTPAGVSCGCLTPPPFLPRGDAVKKSNVSRRKTKVRKLAKPKKPYPGFELCAHNNGKWCKQIKGKIHYFGAWARRENGKLVRVPGDAWEDAFEEYKSVASDLHSRRTPQVDPNELELLVKAQSQS